MYLSNALLSYQCIIDIEKSFKHNKVDLLYVVGSKSFRPDQLFKVNQLPYFSINLPLFQHTFHICEPVTL
jgi:hypothetical protein